MSGFIFHVPHASTAFPPGEREKLLLGDADLSEELLRLTDTGTDRIFLPAMGEGDLAVVFPWSRLLVDVERFREHGREPMAARGMGAVYERTSVGRPLRPSGVDPEPLLARYYDPHHHRLAAATASMIAAHGHAIIIDCHSFPTRPLPCDLDQNPERPQVCLGIDPFHTPEWLVECLEEVLLRHGLGCRRDEPYAGTMVPLEYLGRDERVLSVMIELRRDLYMEEVTGDVLDAEAITAIVTDAIGALRSASAKRMDDAPRFDGASG